MPVKTLELTIFIVLFLAVSAVGFLASRWRRAESMAHLDEWGLGGRSFGGWVTWFLIGGDLYTAYTFVAVPALVLAPVPSGSSPSPTRSWCTRWCSWCWPGSGR